MWNGYDNTVDVTGHKSKRTTDLSTKINMKILKKTIESNVELRVYEALIQLCFLLLYKVIGLIAIFCNIYIADVYSCLA